MNLKRVIKGFGKSFKDLFYYARFRESLGLKLSEFLKLKQSNSDYKSVVAISFHGHRMLLNSPFWFLHTVGEIFVEGIYRFPSASQTPRIIDCGANIGLSVISLLNQYPKARLIAFEPDPAIFSLLSSNLQSYDLTNVKLIQAAVWKGSDTLTFYSEGSVGGKVIETRNDDRMMGSIVIPAIRLKDYLADPVDFLKMDIEGAEYEVLLDCADNLQNVRLMFVEYHSTTGQPQRLNEILSIISAAGFRYYIKQAWDKIRHPFIGKKGRNFDLQLNIFCYRNG